MNVRTHTVARMAYERVAARKDAEYRKKYGALAHRLPGMILQNGLAQATGFLVAKGKDEHGMLLDDLAKVLGALDGVKLHEQVIDADMRQTMRLTRAALEASGWIKRYVQGVLRVTSTGEGDVDEAGQAE